MTVMLPYDAVVSAWAQIAGAPNVVSVQPSDRWVATGASAAVILDLGSVRAVRQIALLYTDLDPADTVNVRASAATADPAADANPVVNQNVTIAELGASADPGYRHVLLHLPASVQARYVRVTLPQGHSAGRLVVGDVLQVEYNPDFGSTSWGFEEAPEPETLDSGVDVLEELPARPIFEFQITWASEAEMEVAWNQRLGPLQWKRRPVLVVRRPDAHAYRHTGIFYGVLRLQPFVAAQFDMFEVSGKIRSMV